jgi:hypothetical protein
MTASLTVAVMLMLAAVAAHAQEPTAAAILEGGDPRSEGAGPGLVGSPIAILLGIVILGLSVAAVTLIILRLTVRDRT